MLAGYRNRVPDTELFHSFCVSRLARQVSNPGIKENLIDAWAAKNQDTYKGFTLDGKVRDGLYKLQDEGAPVKEASAAAEKFLGMLSEEQKKVTTHAIDSDVWGKWANRVFYLITCPSCRLW